MLADAGDRLVSAATRVEAGIVVEARQGRHPAALNLGDCFAYALAKVTGARLLFTGDDLPQTDVLSAV